MQKAGERAAWMDRGSTLNRIFRGGVTVLAGVALVGAFASACAAEDVFEGLGLVSPTPTPAPFVAASRPPGDLPWIGVFDPPPSPRLAALTPAELQAQQDELEAANKRHDALRNGFKPSAAALARQRARNAKAAAKKPLVIEGPGQ